MPFNINATPLFLVSEWFFFLIIVSFRIPMGRLATLYLFTYNSVQAGGWTVALIKLLTNVSSTKSIDGTYDAAGQLICLLQLFSVMEVFHGAIGIVPTKVLPVLMQWGGRTHFVAAIVCQIPEVQKLPTVFVTFAAWSLSEVIRYPQYALNAVGHCPGWLTWLRYSAFVVLYPIGAIFGEVLTMYHALSYIKKKHLYGNLFDKLPFSYYSFVMALLACYPFLWMMLYMYMFKQRKSKLGRRGERKHHSGPKRRVD